MHRPGCRRRSWKEGYSMPFTLIKGRFKPLVGTPDGDSVRFLANDLDLWTKLEGTRVRLGTTQAALNTAQLRFEGIDATEKTAAGGLWVESRDNMLRRIGFDEDTDLEPQGFILARMTDDTSGRPICFVYAGQTTRSDGEPVFLDASMLRDSVNHAQVRDGFAYPLYYNTLFAALREEFNRALAAARQPPARGYWSIDATRSGVTVTGSADLKQIAPIWPKLWRRLQEYFRTAASLDGFVDFLEQKNERVDLLRIMEERGLQDVVAVQGNQVRLTEDPETLRIVGKAGQRRC
jgi:hypothetical protein